MMRTFTTAIALSIVSGAACAQSANSGLEGLESCFQAARLSDAICMNLSNAPAQQVDCFQKGRAAQLECLQHVPSGTSARSMVPEKPTGTDASQAPRGLVQSDMPQAMPPNAASAPTVGRADPVVSPAMPATAVSPGKSTTNASADEATGTISPKPPSPIRPELPAVVSRDRPAPAVSANRPARTLDIPAKPSTENWVVSETSSPIDYSPLVTAQIRARWSEKNAPDSLILRCRQSHVELLLGIAAAARVAPRSDIQVSYQLNDQSFVKQQWIASADGKTASYPDDAAALLRSLPEGARLTIDMFDGSGPGRNAMFQLTGLDAIRRKIELACKSLSGRFSSEKR
ncbi:MAG: hypothetical protein ABI196_12905 [Bradyrhizobium sp.]